MLEIQEVDQSLAESLAPEVFIDLVCISSTEDGATKFSINFHLEDPEEIWINDESLLNDIFLIIKNSLSTKTFLFKKTLKDIKNSSVFKNNQLHSKLEFSTLEPSNCVIDCYCGNDNLQGITTRQRLTGEDVSIPQASIDDVKFNYINKVLDLRTLDVEIKRKNNYDDTIPGNVSSGLVISYTTNKKSNFGFAFSLKNYLIKNSNVFKYLDGYNNFSEIVLKNSSIDIKKSFFYKKNISKKYQEWESINNEIKVLKIDDNDYKYLITCSDRPKSILEMDEYSVGINLTINDYSTNFFKTNIIEKLSNSKNFLLLYKSKIESILKNKNVSNAYEHFFNTLMN